MGLKIKNISIGKHTATIIESDILKPGQVTAISHKDMEKVIDGMGYPVRSTGQRPFKSVVTKVTKMS